jgi:CheY-like chemotaxis protein
MNIEKDFSDFPKGNETILLVDDDKSVSVMLKKFLGEILGYKAVLAESGIEALEIFQKNPKIDLIILDMTMPGMSGDEVFKRIRKVNSDIPTLILSGYHVSSEKIDEILRQPKTGFIAKPFLLQPLAEKIRELLEI